MIEWPEPLVDDVARRKAILFLGSGVSANSEGTGGARPPTWEQFLRLGLQRCPPPTKHIASLLKRNDYLTACEVLRNKLDDDWNRLVDDSFRVPQYAAADIHRHIFKLDVRLVLTQNVDKIYDTLAQQESNNTVVVKNYYDDDVAANLREHKQLVIKAHGTIDSIERMVFTREQYAKARYEYGAFYDFLDALILTHTFVFVGCGLSDPDVQLLLERHTNRFPYGRPHYMCAGQRGLHNDLVASIRRNYNLKVLKYSEVDGHKELTESIQDLVGRVDLRRDDIATSQRW